MTGAVNTPQDLQRLLIQRAGGRVVAGIVMQQPQVVEHGRIVRPLRPVAVLMDRQCLAKERLGGRVVGADTVQFGQVAQADPIVQAVLTSHVAVVIHDCALERHRVRRAAQLLIQTDDRVQCLGDARIGRALNGLLNLQDLEIDRDRGSEIPLRGVEQRQIVQGRADAGVSCAEDTALDLQGLTVVLLGGGQFFRVVVGHGQVEEAAGVVRVIVSQRARVDVERRQHEGFGLGVVLQHDVHPGQFVQAGRVLGMIGSERLPRDVAHLGRQGDRLGTLASLEDKTSQRTHARDPTRSIVRHTWLLSDREGDARVLRAWAAALTFATGSRIV